VGEQNRQPSRLGVRLVGMPWARYRWYAFANGEEAM
jgi:hypothetical protein